MTRLEHWVGDDDPHRRDSATVRFGAGAGDSGTGSPGTDRLTAHGTSHTRDYSLGWSLTTGARWVTRSLEVTVYGAGFSRRLLLERADDGRWSHEASQTGQCDLPPAGIVDAASIADALDCDLALCPVTNTMPILRLGLIGGDAPDTALVMAWVEVPSLRVLRSDQVYGSLEPLDQAADRAVVRYQSVDREFVSDLTVDSDGLVIDYPGLARRVRPVAADAVTPGTGEPPRDAGLPA